MIRNDMDVIKPADSPTHISDDLIEYNGNSNTLTFKQRSVTIPLTERQSRLISSILNNITDKRQIIDYVWYENSIAITDNNYHQLIHQCRTQLARSGIPANVIKTIPRHGIRFDYSPVAELPQLQPEQPLQKKDSSFENRKTRLLLLASATFAIALLVTMMALP